VSYTHRQPHLLQLDGRNAESVDEDAAVRQLKHAEERHEEGGLATARSAHLHGKGQEKGSRKGRQPEQLRPMGLGYLRRGQEEASGSVRAGPCRARSRRWRDADAGGSHADPFACNPTQRARGPAYPYDPHDYINYTQPITLSDPTTPIFSPSLMWKDTYLSASGAPG
jgi:hypothetical protein